MTLQMGSGVRRGGDGGKKHTYKASLRFSTLCVTGAYSMPSLSELDFLDRLLVEDNDLGWMQFWCVHVGLSTAPKLSLRYYARIHTVSLSSSRLTCSSSRTTGRRHSALRCSLFPLRKSTLLCPLPYISTTGASWKVNTGISARQWC